MNLVLDINEIKYNNIFFYESVKNTVMNDSGFIRIIYSNSEIILNGIYIKIDVKDENIQLFDNIDILERTILNQYNSNKLQNNKLKDQLFYNINRINRINKDNEYIYLLKISGIWETEHMIGLTYKFILYE
jgi:hypothetical protein